jgi:hypothetical protein
MHASTGAPSRKRKFRLPLFVALLAVSGLGPNLPLRAAEPEPKLQWFKGNTHTHSLWSDGNDFPEMITDWYQKKGYHFLAISDHNVLHAKEVWMTEPLIKKRQIALGKTALVKYQERFGSPWVETRIKDGVTEVRLKKLEEYRPLFEKPGQFLLVQAEEISAGFKPAEADKSIPIHINAVNVREEIQPLEGTSVREVMRKNLQAIHEQAKATGQPMLGHINHPNFRWALTPEDLAEVLEENFFEIFNGHPMINYLGDATRPGHEAIWDIANTLRLSKLKAPPLYGVATDDAHHYHGENSAPGRGWVMVRAAALDANKLVTALRAGEFYASSGVTLQEVTFENEQLRLVIQAEPGVTYTTKFVGTPVSYDRTTGTIPPADDDSQKINRTTYSADVGKTFATVVGTSPSYTLGGDELYVRAVVTSSKPHPSPTYEGQTEVAWTQPIGWEPHLK